MSVEHTIGEKYVLGKKIGSGAFGEIFIGNIYIYIHTILISDDENPFY